MNRLGVRRIAPYALIGIVVWAGVLKSGVHATLAGVLVALTIPIDDRKGVSPLEQLEHALHPWVTYFIMPLFAFANIIYETGEKIKMHSTCISNIESHSCRGHRQ